MSRKYGRAQQPRARSHPGGCPARAHVRQRSYYTTDCAASPACPMPSRARRRHTAPLLLLLALALLIGCSASISSLPGGWLPGTKAWLAVPARRLKTDDVPKPVDVPHQRAHDAQWRDSSDGVHSFLVFNYHLEPNPSSLKHVESIAPDFDFVWGASTLTVPHWRKGSWFPPEIFVLGHGANSIQELPNRTTANRAAKSHGGFSGGHGVKPGSTLGGCFLKTDDHALLGTESQDSPPTSTTNNKAKKHAGDEHGPTLVESSSSRTPTGQPNPHRLWSGNPLAGEDLMLTHPLTVRSPPATAFHSNGGTPITGGRKRAVFLPGLPALPKVHHSYGNCRASNLGVCTQPTWSLAA